MTHKRTLIHLLQNPGTSDVYIEHSVQATVARYAPSGYYIASGGNHILRIDWVYNTYMYAVCYTCAFGPKIVFLEEEE